MKTVFTTLLVFILFSCKKEEDRSCFKTIGSHYSKEILVQNVRDLVLNSDITYLLVLDSQEKVVLKGGKNLLNFIAINQVGNELTIENNNKCAFLRNYKDDIVVEIHYVDLKTISFSGSKLLKSSSPLQIDTLSIRSFDGSGTIDLAIQANCLKLNAEFGYTDFLIKGTVNYLTCNFGGSAFADLYNLQINDSITVVSNSQRDVKTKPSNVRFKAQVNQSGNILYKGIPSSIYYSRFGTGELINAN